jgi:predicted hydrocarbon binding protein
MNQILESLSFEPDEGKLHLQGLRYLLMRPGMVAEIQKALESRLPEAVEEILCHSAQNEGLVLASRLKEVFSYSPEQVLSSLAFMLAESGWGAISVQMLNAESMEMVVKIRESPFAEEYGPSVTPVCHLLLGLLQGVGMALFECDVDGQEVQCAAKGDASCLIVVSGKPAPALPEG